MNPILLNPKIDSSAPTMEQLAQMKSYLRQFKEEVELILMNVGRENLSEPFSVELQESMTKTMKNADEVSRVTQTASMIRAEVFDSNGASRITQTAAAISAEVSNRQSGDSELSSRITAMPGRFNIATSMGNDKLATFTLLVDDETGGSQTTISSDTISFDGLVSFNDLSTPGQSTFINGANIATGTIDADKINISDLLAVISTFDKVTISDGSIRMFGTGSDYSYIDKNELLFQSTGGSYLTIQNGVGINIGSSSSRFYATPSSINIGNSSSEATLTNTKLQFSGSGAVTVISPTRVTTDDIIALGDVIFARPFTVDGHTATWKPYDSLQSGDHVLSY